jgi:signal transduction histidine kinase/HAMP domain-containing protein
MILSRLFMLLAVALVPAVAIQAFHEYDLRRGRQAEVQDQALALAKLAAAEQQQTVSGIRQVLIAMSEVPAIRAKDSAACNAYLAAVKQQYPAFITFLAADMNGRSFCNTTVGDKSVVNVAARPYFARVVKTGAFTVGQYSIGLSNGRRVIQFALPFYGDDGRMSGVIVAALSLDWLANHIAQKSIPAGAALAITDRNGTYLARYPDNDDYIGKQRSNEEYLKKKGGGVADITGSDGVERIVGYAPLDADSGLFVGFGLDKAQAFVAIERGTRRGVVVIVLSALLILVLTSLGARRFIDRPLSQLVDVANEWRRGEYSRRVKLPNKSEIARVGDAFNTMADALERRERELAATKEKAEEAAARIITIFESTTDSVLIIDPDWRVSFLNGRARAQVDEGRNVIGMKLWEAFPDAADTEIVNRFRRAMSDRRPVSFEASCPRNNVWYAFNAFPSDQGLAVYFRDITEQKQAVEARRLMEEQLHQSQKMEAVGQLTGGVAHDFNNLLTVVTGNLELIEKCAADSHKVQRLAAAAQHAADRGAKLTAQLLAFSRRQTLNPKLVSASRLLYGFHEIIRRAVGTGCQFKVLSDEQLWLCYVDPSLLESALLNLALNARDAMRDGGALTIETRNIVLSEGEVAGCSSGAYVELSVMDTGCGMSPEVRDRIFEPFFTTKEVGKGTGLGLSMVYGFVHQSGGHIAVKSALGVGTTFILYLPKAAQESDVEEQAGSSQALPTGSGRILLVEDDDDILELTSVALTQLGYQVVCARDGEKAKRMLASGQEFDLLFSDVVMPPGIDGVELAREATRLNKGIKILLTSGNAEDVLARHNAVGEFPIVRKPFRRADLAQRLRSILETA